MKQHPLNRRNLLRAGIASAIAAPLIGDQALAQQKPAGAASPDPWRGLKVGVASYTLRKLPTDAAIQAIRRLGLHYVSIKDFHLPLTSTPDERRRVAQQFKDAGITPISCGVITMPNNETTIRNAFDYARDAGIPVIVCSPDPAALPILDRMVKEYDIRLAIHNHGPEDKHWPSPYDIIRGIGSLDQRIGICLDVGHTARVNVDPADAARKLRNRIYDVHLKDINSTAPNGRPIEGGRGVIDFPSVLKALIDIKYAYHVGFEYEKDADDPMPGLSETVGYTRGVLTMPRK